jgi:hypothetical protein
MDFLMAPFKMVAAAVGLRERSEPTNSDRPASPPKKRRRKAERSTTAQREKELQASEQAERIKIHQKLKQEEEYRRKANELRKIRQREEENRRKAEEYDKRKQRERTKRLRQHERMEPQMLAAADAEYERERAEREKDDHYPSGRAQRQEHVKTLRTTGFRDWEPPTEANIVRPQKGKGGEDVYRVRFMTAQKKYPGLRKALEDAAYDAGLDRRKNEISEEQYHQKIDKLNEKWEDAKASVDEFVGGKRRLKYPRAKGNLFYMNKKSRGRRITMRLVHKHPEAFKGSEFRHLLRPRSLTRKKKRSLLRKKKRSHSRRTRKVMRSRVHQSRKRRTRRK